MTALALPLPCTVADHLALARREVAPGLVSPPAWGRLHAIRDPLPPTAEEAALEVRLEDGDSRVDLAVGLRAGPARRELLAKALARAGAAEEPPAWRRVHAFLREWAREASPLHHAVHALWLEFDAEGPGEPQPFLVFSLDGELLYARGTAAPEAVLLPLRRGLDRLAEGLDPASCAALARCVRGLPPSAQVRHAAVRPTAAGDAVRLVVRMPWRRLSGALAGLGWSGDPRRLDALLGTLCRETPVHQVNLDLLPDGPGPRVGIEFVHLGAPRESPRWKALLDALEAHGACSGHRRAAIGAWGGTSPGPSLGPGRLVVRRDLLVKVVYEEDAPLRAKAYLGFAPRLLPHRAPQPG